MNVLHVNDVDLPGRIFNGYNLCQSLREEGYYATQIVKKKYGDDDNTKTLGCNLNSIVESNCIQLEELFSINDIIGIGAKQLEVHPNFIQSDIVHYHLVHNHLISILDFPRLTKKKSSVWTIHDPWMLTGHCIHPMECQKWRTGCVHCEKLEDHFSLKRDNAHQMWKIKQAVYKEMNIDLVVASEFMEEYIQSSPFSEYFPRIHRIPFGVEAENFEKYHKKTTRKSLRIPESDFVIGFRNEEYELKGSRYAVQMLELMPPNKEITVLTVGTARLPEKLKEKFNIIELGWQNDDTVMKQFYASCSVFLMPSLAESFGLMAIEAMASGIPVVVFADTVLPEITYAPECGIVVPFKSSSGLRDAVELLMMSPEEVNRRGILGKKLVKEYYKYSDYVKKHIELYEEIAKRNR